MKAEHFMGVPTSYTTTTLNGILRRLYNERKNVVNHEVNKVLKERVRSIFEGMKVESLFELLEYLSKKGRASVKSMETSV